MADLPYPPHDGGRADLWGRVVALKTLGHHIHLLVTQPRNRTDEAAIAYVSSRVDTLQFVSRRSLLTSIVGIAPTLVKRNATLAEFQVEGCFDVVLAESEQVIAIFDNPVTNGAARVLRMHNDESAYMRSLARSESRLWKRLFFCAESIRYRRCIPSFWRKADRIWAISSKEYGNLKKSSNRWAAKARWLPPTLEDSCKLTKRSPIAGRVLFVANLGGPINQDALKWYLDHVHPRLLHIPTYHFVFAGNTGAGSSRDNALPVLQRLLKTQACTVMADPATLDSIYNESAIFINPMQCGAGVKLKTVQAAAAGVPIVSTTVGNDGTGLLPDRHISIANSPDEFVNAVVGLLADRTAAEANAAAALEFVRTFYTAAALEHLLLEAIHA
jgi:glycosyltransferase involved in cell wall biosynthesis